MPSWTAAERDALRRAVSVHGHAWDAIAASGACPGRDSRSLQWAWCAQSGGGLVAESGTAIVPSLHPLVCGPVAPVESLPEKLFIQTARSIHSGRPWDYIATRGGEREAPREPTILQWACVHNWSLYNARGGMDC